MAYVCATWTITLSNEPYAEAWQPGWLVKGVACTRKQLENLDYSGIMGSGDVVINGAYGAIPRSDNARMDKHAELFYGEVRKRTSDVGAIAKNSGFSETDVKRIKNHIFINKHELGAEIPQRFIPDYDMAISWQRLIDGVNIQDMDIVLLNHELHELRLMEQGISYSVAHREAEKSFNYRAFTKELDAREGIL